MEDASTRAGVRANLLGFFKSFHQGRMHLNPAWRTVLRPIKDELPPLKVHMLPGQSIVLGNAHLPLAQRSNRLWQVFGKALDDDLGQPSNFFLGHEPDATVVLV